MKINNLAHLKRALQKDATFRIVRHQKWPDIVGLIRVVDSVQSNAIYTKILNQPEHRISLCNGGRGLRMEFEKASYYRFGDTVKVYENPGKDESLLYEFEVLDKTA